MPEEAREEIKLSGKMITVPLGQRGEGEFSMATEAQEKCVSAGMTLMRDHLSYRKATPVLFPINLRGQVTTDDLKVPQSELAMATGAAGKDIIAFSLVGETGGIVAFDDGKRGCEFTFGASSELFTPALVKKVNEIWEKRGPD